MRWLELIVFVYFSFVASYHLLFSISGLFYRPPSFLKRKPKKNNRVVVLIPAYKEDAVIIKTALQALDQSYPRSMYDVVVIADSLQKATLDSLRQLDIILHEVEFQKSTKVKSLTSALDAHFQYDIAIILDADNVMCPDFIEQINIVYENGWQAIQGQRMAKNNNSSFAILDGLSEMISNHIYRKGSIALGLSSPIIGSGMAFDLPMLRDVLNSFSATGGFDKALQVKILQQGKRIRYLNTAIVYDEKVDSPDVFQNQRLRWVSSQYIYLKKFFPAGMRALFTGNFSLFNIAILMSIQFSRILNIGLLFLICLTQLLLPEYFYMDSVYWLLVFGLYLLSFVIAVPLQSYNHTLLLALLRLPRAFFTMALVHLKLKDANKEFIHTPHKHG